MFYHPFCLYSTDKYLNWVQGAGHGLDKQTSSLVNSILSSPLSVIDVLFAFFSSNFIKKCYLFVIMMSLLWICFTILMYHIFMLSENIISVENLMMPYFVFYFIDFHNLMVISCYCCGEFLCFSQYVHLLCSINICVCINESMCINIH